LLLLLLLLFQVIVAIGTRGQKVTKIAGLEAMVTLKVGRCLLVWTATK
jgi:hypothetical protein